MLSIACGQYHTALSMERSGVWCFGKNDYGQLGINSPDSKILPCRVSEPLLGVTVWQLAAGYYHTLALTADVRARRGLRWRLSRWWVRR